ncbi:TetR/AcrR family transcriptional regulator C-terminal domain-containing protein [Streptomyces sp. CA-181903]|uniref:TetR/AcrR family transcriptional regulator C-terminal domain-containing protein n=1 Tax=Streptomyces sp. CA-181903 TaxID=3240055 RepID=UPI003D8C7053
MDGVQAAMVQPFSVGDRPRTLHEAVPMSAVEERGASPAEAVEEARERLAALSAERYPHLVALAGELTGPDMDSRFEFGLALLLDGLGVLREAGAG